MKRPRPQERQNPMLPPVRRPAKHAAGLQSTGGRSISWVEGYSATPRKDLSTQQLTAYLATIGAPVVLARPLPTVAVMLATNQLSNDSYTIAGTVEVHGCRYVNFHLQNIDINENGILARPFRIIESVKFVDDFEDPYALFDGFEVRIPVVCDCEQVGLEVMSYTPGFPALYNVGVGMTP